MKKIPLTQGKFTVVNDIDYAFLMQWGWYYNNRYAKRASRKSDRCNKRKTIYMHRVILNRKLGHRSFEKADHKNRNTLDNCRGNLRPASYSQDAGNTKLRGGSSKFKGVSWDKDRKKWRSYIRFEGVREHIGRFDSEIEAAEAYNTVAARYFGRFSQVNSVDN